MSETQAPARPFAVGDTVEFRRNLEHPAWRRLVNADLRNGGSKWVPIEGTKELIGSGEITKAGIWHGRPCVYSDATRFWYHQDTGLQEGSEATFIVHVVAQEGA